MDYKNLLLLKGFNLNVYDEGVFWELEILKEVTTSHNGETITLYDGKIKELCKLLVHRSILIPIVLQMLIPSFYSVSMILLNVFFVMMVMHGMLVLKNL